MTLGGQDPRHHLAERGVVIDQQHHLPERLLGGHSNLRDRPRRLVELLQHLAGREIICRLSGAQEGFRRSTL